MGSYLEAYGTGEAHRAQVLHRWKIGISIGVAALLLQLRLRPNLSSIRASSARGPLWLNSLGVICAIGALLADILHLNEGSVLVVALAAVVSFAVSGIIILNALRKQR